MSGALRRFGKLAGIGASGAIANIVIQILSVPLLIQFWGLETYGQWLSIYALHFIVRFLDAGYSLYVANKIQLSVQSDVFEARQILASSIVGTMIVTLVQVGFTVAMIWLFVSKNFVSQFPLATAKAELSFALLVLVGGYCLSCVFGGLLHRCLMATGRMQMGLWWGVGSSVLQPISIVYAAYLGLGVLGCSCVLASVQAAIHIGLGCYVRRILPSLKPWLPYMSLRLGLNDFWKSLPFALSSWVQQLFGNAMVVLIGWRLGTSTVPVFSALRTLSNTPVSFLGLQNAILTPELIRLQASARIHRIQHIHDFYWVFTSVGLCSLVALCMPLFQPVFVFWTKHQLTFDPLTASCLMASAVLLTFCNLAMAHLSAVNIVSFALTIPISKLVAGCGLAWLLMAYHGVGGAGIALLASELLALLLILEIFFKNYAQSQFPDFRFNVFRATIPIVIVGSLLIASFGFLRDQLVSYYALIAAFASIGSIAIFRSFDMSQRTFALKTVRAIFQRH